ncbi:hypothetical protein ANCCAN_29510 [Ancylostoma caninum]|uniref:Uncharacterized protein n=1 Tax=Ancylostoma caninum TaxID=29170 RepID=A0A368F3M1_ANCCA|nr:hypothetical protein ANCCAN_29510 [Ancylostoma caninum]
MWSIIKSLVSRILLVYFVTNIIKSFSGGPPQVADNVAHKQTGLQPSRNLFPPGQLFNLHLYLDDSVCCVCL